jgi:hypothetical protein
MIEKLKAEIKLLFLTKVGLLSWVIANTITSLPWFLPLAYGFVFNDQNGYWVASAIYAFILAPFTPFWILNVIIARFFNKNIFKADYSSSLK